MPKPLSAIDVQQSWHVVKDERYPWHGQYLSKLYLFAIRAAVDAQRRWMAGEAGFPRFKRRSNRMAFRVCETIDLRAGRLLLPKLGGVRSLEHRTCSWLNARVKVANRSGMARPSRPDGTRLRTNPAERR